jgi:hypothetical protein
MSVGELHVRVKQSRLNRLESYKVIGWLKRNKTLYLTSTAIASAAKAKEETGVDVNDRQIEYLAHLLEYRKHSEHVAKAAAGNDRVARLEVLVAHLYEELGIKQEEVP